MRDIQLHMDADPDVTGRQPVLMLVHGVTQENAYWEPIRGALRGSGPTVAVEMLAHGASPAPEDQEAYTMEAYLDYFEDALTRLGLRSAWWIGHSMGGYLELRLALERPQLVEGLVLTSIAPGMGDPAQRAAQQETDRALIAGVEAHGMGWFFEQFNTPILAAMKAPPEIVEAARARVTRISPRGMANQWRIFGRGMREPVWERLPEIAVPTLVVCGTEDTHYVVDAERMAQEIPGAKLELIPDAGHALNFAQPQAVAAAITRFLADLS